MKRRRILLWSGIAGFLALALVLRGLVVTDGDLTLSILGGVVLTAFLLLVRLGVAVAESRASPDDTEPK